MRGPIFNAVTRIATRRALRQKGYSFRQVNEMMAAASDDLIDAVLDAEAIPVPVALGDGSIIRAIFDFLESEQGQRLIQAILTLLMSLI